MIGLLSLTCVSLAQEDDVSTSLPEGEQYEGELVNGIREGFGRLMYPDGRVYEGEFSAGLPSDSTGVLTFADGHRYSGTFVAGRMHGYGTFEFANGDVYVGTFDTNSITGTGTYYWRDSNVTYEGTVEDGKLHGYGVMQWPDGRSYNGAFSQDKRHGFGIYLSADGSNYRGFFEEGERHGDGVYRNQTGDLEFQQWNAGRLQSRRPLQTIEHCKLSIDGFDWMFDGSDCINGIAHGTGTAVRSDGLAYINRGSFIVGNMVSGVIISLSGEGG